MIEVQLKPYLLKFQNQLKTAVIKNSLFGVQDFEELQESFDLIVSSLQENEDYFIEIEQHKIDRFNLGPHAIALANAGESLHSISKTLGIISNCAVSPEELKDWFDNYSNLTYSRKQKNYGNIFNVQERMQQVYQELQDQLELIRSTDKEEFFRGKTTREQVILEVLNNLRVLTKDAKDILKTVDEHQRLEEFKSLVIETIRKVDPIIATSIIEKLTQDQTLFKALLPPK